MIEIIDKVNLKVKSVPNDIEVIIDPNGNTVFLKDYQLKGQRIFGVIHKEDGSTIFLYKNIRKEKDEIKKEIESSDIFLAMIDEYYFDNPKTIEQFLYAKLLDKPMVILEENNELQKFPEIIKGCDILLILPLTEDNPTPEELDQKIKEALKKRSEY